MCGVGPSRGLELCASSRPTSETWERSRDGHVTQLQSSTSLPSVGFLRSARLYPLGVVDTLNCNLNSSLALYQVRPPLYIIYHCMSPSRVVDSRSKGEQRRPVSWVGTRTQAERRNKDSELADCDVERERNRHSFSGDSNCLQRRSRLISLPRNTALVPTASMSVEPTRTKKQTSVLSGKSRTLFPLVRQKSAHANAGQEIRVEVRSSRDSEYGNSLKSTGDKTVAGSVLSATLPDLPSNTAAPDTQSLTTPQQPKAERKQMSIVSVGSTGATAAGKARQQKPLPADEGPHSVLAGRRGNHLDRSLSTLSIETRRRRGHGEEAESFRS